MNNLYLLLMTYFLVAELEFFMGEGFKAKLIKYKKKIFK